jgi:acyl-CoA reductase-like NAD-dependent aldehyde dehydrogenase
VDGSADMRLNWHSQPGYWPSRYSDPEEALARANASPYGLGGSVWSADPNRAYDLAKRMDVGTVWINKHGELVPDIPLGGAKQSGIGSEFGQE